MKLKFSVLGKVEFISLNKPLNELTNYDISVLVDNFTKLVIHPPPYIAASKRIILYKNNGYSLVQAINLVVNCIGINCEEVE